MTTQDLINKVFSETGIKLGVRKLKGSMKEYYQFRTLKSNNEKLLSFEYRNNLVRGFGYNNFCSDYSIEILQKHFENENK